MRISGHGIALEVPDGWEARILRRADAGPVLHFASSTLRAGDGDFGAAATGRLGPDDVFGALVEYRGTGLRTGEGLFAPVGLPSAPRPHEFSHRALQVTRRGQLGRQRFFTEGGRTCCLYLVVVPARRRIDELVADLRGVLATLRMTAIP